MRQIPPTDGNYILIDYQAEAFLSDPVGNMTVKAKGAATSLPFVVLDHFDQTLRKTGRILIQSGAQTTLMYADGRVLNQISSHAVTHVQNLPDGAVRQALKDLSPLRALVPVGMGTVQQAHTNFVDNEGKSRCRAIIDSFTPTGGIGFVIARLAALRGYEKALASLGDHALVCGGVPFDLVAFYRLLCPDLVGYEAKPEIRFLPNDSAFNVAGKIISAHIPVMRANEVGIVGDTDSEFLHDYRVALRKIRSVLSLFKGVYSESQTTALKCRFSALMAPTGALRDIDVFLLEKQGYRDLLPASLHSGLDAQFSLILKQRKSAKARLARHLQSKAYEAEISELAVVFAQESDLDPGPNAKSEVYDFACDLIWKRYRKICRIARQISQVSEDAEVHALRIECKKLRYLLEFFGSLFLRSKYRSLIKPLKALQDNLGRVHDCEVQQANLQSLLKSSDRWQSGDRLDLAQSIGALTTVLHSQQTGERAKTLEYLAHFDSPQIQRTFRKLFHARKDSE